MHTFMTGNYLARAWRIQGDFQKSFDLLQSLEKAESESPGSDRHLYVQQNLACACAAMGDHEQATVLTRRIVTELKQDYGESHYRTWAAVMTLGFAMYDSGEKEEGLKILERCYALIVERYGIDHALSKIARQKIDLLPKKTKLFYQTDI